MFHARHVLAAALASGLAATTAPVSAQEEGSPFGLGFQSSWPAWGVSGIYDVSETITAQAVLGAFGTVSTFSGRGLYHFQRQPAYSVFGFGTLGLMRHSFRVLGERESESTIGVGGGAGLELNWQDILSDDNGESKFPPLFSNIDIGFTFANFDNYNWSAFTLGAGLHYRF